MDEPPHGELKTCSAGGMESTKLESPSVPFDTGDRMRRTRYQQGSLTLAERKRDRKTWEYRWWETGTDGRRNRRCLVVGTLQDYPTEGLAQRALDTLRKDINVEHPRSSLQATTMRALIEHYEDKEMGEHSTKTFATCVTYRGYFRKWIKPRWGEYQITRVKAVVVEEWLRSLPLANGSKAKIRNMMHALFRHAIRWDWIEHNPITSVRQSAKRQEIPAVLSMVEVGGAVIAAHRANLRRRLRGRFHGIARRRVTRLEMVGY